MKKKKIPGTKKVKTDGPKSENAALMTLCDSNTFRTSTLLINFYRRESEGRGSGGEGDVGGDDEVLKEEKEVEKATSCCCFTRTFLIRFVLNLIRKVTCRRNLFACIKNFFNCCFKYFVNLFIDLLNSVN